MTDRRVAVPRRQNADRRAADRRDGSRIHSDARIRFLRAGSSADAILEGELLDASPTGVRLLLGEQMKSSEKLLIEVRDGGDRCFNLTAETVWSQLVSGGPPELPLQPANSASSGSSHKAPLEPAEQCRWTVGCELCVPLSARQHAILRRLASGRL